MAIFILFIYHDRKHRKKRPIGLRIMTITDIAKHLQNPWCLFRNAICEVSKIKAEQERKEGEEEKGRQSYSWTSSGLKMPLSCSKVSRYPIFPKIIYHLISENKTLIQGEETVYYILIRHSFRLHGDDALPRSLGCLPVYLFCPSWLPLPFPTTGRFSSTKDDGSVLGRRCSFTVKSSRC